MRLKEILQKINTFTYFARKCLLVAVEIIWWNNCANVSKIFYCDLKVTVNDSWISNTDKINLTI